MALTQDQIFSVADDIDARGQKPTLTAVREALGGGSYSTISQGMAAWRARKAAGRTGPSEPLPDALAGALSALGETVWTAALETAHARYSGEREAFEQERSQNDAQRQEAVELADALTAEMERLRAQLEQANVRAEMAGHALAGVREELTEEKVRAARAESRAEALEARVQTLTAENERQHAHSAQLSQALTRLAEGAQAGRGGGNGPGETG